VDKPQTIDVSVLTPSYGYGRFIEDTILSVLRQEGIVTEHIIQDASSTDETLDVLRSYDEVIRWRSEPDRGQSDALNKALAQARGRWIAWLNADEFYLPGGLAKLVETGERSSAEMVYSDAVFVDVDGRFLRLVPQHGYSPRLLRWYGCYIASCAVIFRRSALGEAPWDANLRRIMDWDLYLKLAANGARGVYVPYAVGAFRVHPDRLTARRLANPEGFVPAFWQRHRTGRPAVRRFALRPLGRGLHGIRKLAGGGYVRQLRARSHQGVDLRWFRPGPGEEGWNALARDCYSLPHHGYAQGS
jgi:glycosyltransferase involved in cell wall biosynthesis